MTQIFHPRVGLLVKLILLALLVLASAAVLAWRGLTNEPHRIGEAVEQPVPFSHKHHVGDDGIDCRYCHATVETSAFAGMPPIATCMTCHSQLYTDQAMLRPVVQSWRSGVALHWQRVHQLPDFVYFNHAIHVAKGVGCESCHGRVDRMALTMRTRPLSMKWCLDCHRAPQNYLRPREEEFAMDWKAQDQQKLGLALIGRYHIDTRRLADCSVCHR
ncbi:MAG: cytochrome c3 family protein [Frateuria sp.]|uniref:cytochrome c3 family protein n=1 Tax=Frateuria sp. TaxID=2211372 RepID=UPI00180BF340|nr:cytochrome c3 family protein [Frateuria sp.]NUO73517.1 cytochrome c3 family protein [Frateuria sp.]NUR23879.1 cytochrome c3 family protein [Frateuria sp.]